MELKDEWVYFFLLNIISENIWCLVSSISIQCAFYINADIFKKRPWCRWKVKAMECVSLKQPMRAQIWWKSPPTDSLLTRTLYNTLKDMLNWFYTCWIHANGKWKMVIEIQRMIKEKPIMKLNMEIAKLYYIWHQLQQ